MSAAARPCAAAAPSTSFCCAQHPRIARRSVAAAPPPPTSSTSFSKPSSVALRRSLLRRSTGVARASESATTTIAASLPPLLPLDASYADTHKFSDVAHWIVPGALLVGRYPYVEPSRCKNDRERGEAQLKDVLERGGVRTFVCLQGELPPQEKMPVGGVGGFLPYRPTATLIAAALSGPPSIEVMEGLRNPHLDAFLPPRRKADRHAGDASRSAAASERRRVELEFYHRPLDDMEVPETTQAVKDIVSEVIEPALTRSRDGDDGSRGVVYLHCWGGRGRAGMVAAATLAMLYGVSADEALARVDAALKTREPEGKAPQTREQVEFVRRLISEL